jgi:hypothetical protein
MGAGEDLPPAAAGIPQAESLGGVGSPFRDKAA